MGKPVVIKTRQTAASVADFINTMPDERQRRESMLILEMMQKASGEEARMWGPSIIGFGRRMFRSPKTGREVEWFRVGFSPRKGYFSLYLASDIVKHAPALKKLGKHKTGVGCLYINKLEDVDSGILEELIMRGLEDI
ncbi:MAG TPA: DUF1801 domain-containing protein [Bacteroidales bacterium]|nr:DUF1801 domain-containing protein [Bacteroidales bacterium]HSA44467.1 DUF1801 domain-containing protein [Bacteroidales bacterium]